MIGSRGASIDELVEDEVSGKLVPVGDPAGLADALVAAWRQPLLRNFPAGATLRATEPQRAIDNLLRTFDRLMAAGNLC